MLQEVFVLQVGDKSNSVDRLKPVFSSVPVTPAVPLPQGQPGMVPVCVMTPPVPVRLQKKKVCFSVSVQASTKS